MPTHSIEVSLLPRFPDAISAVWVGVEAAPSFSPSPLSFSSYFGVVVVLPFFLGDLHCYCWCAFLGCESRAVNEIRPFPASPPAFETS